MEMMEKMIRSDGVDKEVMRWVALWGQSRRSGHWAPAACTLPPGSQVEVPASHGRPRWAFSKHQLSERFGTLRDGNFWITKEPVHS